MSTRMSQQVHMYTEFCTQFAFCLRNYRREKRMTISYCKMANNRCFLLRRFALIYIYVYIYIYVHIYTHVCMYAYIHIHIRERSSRHVSPREHASPRPLCPNKLMYIYMYTYLHTYIHIHIQRKILTPCRASRARISSAAIYMNK